MTLEVRVREEARIDLQEAAVWYETQSAGLGAQFLDEAERVFVQIADSPSIYRVIHRDTRRAFLQRSLSLSYSASRATSH